MADTIYIALVDTRDEIAGTGANPREAIKVACTLALAYLKDRGVTEHKTIKDVEEYFGVSAFPVKIGGATFTKG